MNATKSASIKCYSLLYEKLTHPIWSMCKSCVRLQKKTDVVILSTVCLMCSMESIASTKGAGPLILDGGLATELEAQGFELQGDPLWSSRLLHTNPQAIRDAHYRFLVSGADVVSTATYQASINGFMKHLDMSSESAQELMKSGVHLAQEAVQQFVTSNNDTERGRPLVAGSVGAFGAFLLDGSEYSGAYAEKMSIEELKAWHRPQIGCLVSAGADLVAMETIPSVKEASALMELLREFPSCRAWLAFSCKDGRSLCDGSPFLEAVRMAQRSSQLVAVGVNCCSPALVLPLLETVSQLRSPALPWVVYPNSGEEWDRLSGWKASGTKVSSIAELSQEWMKQGATMIGDNGATRHVEVLHWYIRTSSEQIPLVHVKVEFNKEPWVLQLLAPL